MEIMDEAYYLKFPSVLKKALQDKVVKFPEELEKSYETFHVYRGIRYKAGEKENVDKTDFLSQAERRLPGTDYDDIGEYSCSCFEKLEELRLAYSLPRKNKGIAEGTMSCEAGARWKDRNDMWDTHWHWFLYDDIDPSRDFKVCNYEYEKVDTSK